MAGDHLKLAQYPHSPLRREGAPLTLLKSCPRRLGLSPGRPLGAPPVPPSSPSLPYRTGPPPDPADDGALGFGLGALLGLRRPALGPAGTSYWTCCRLPVSRCCSYNRWPGFARGLAGSQDPNKASRVLAAEPRFPHFLEHKTGRSACLPALFGANRGATERALKIHLCLCSRAWGIDSMSRQMLHCGSRSESAALIVALALACVLIRCAEITLGFGGGLAGYHQ